MTPDHHFDLEDDAMPQAGRPVDGHGADADRPGDRGPPTPRMEIARVKEENAKLAVRRRRAEREIARLEGELRDARALAATRLLMLENAGRSEIAADAVFDAVMGTD